jgi:heme/copper-type cytochrome/quinol oxidase subunit 2
MSLAEFWVACYIVMVAAHLFVFATSFFICLLGRFFELEPRYKRIFAAEAMLSFVWPVLVIAHIARLGWYQVQELD